MLVNRMMQWSCRLALPDHRYRLLHPSVCRDRGIADLQFEKPIIQRFVRCDAGQLIKRDINRGDLSTDRRVDVQAALTDSKTATA